MNVDAILRRHAQLKQKRLLLEQHWRECYDFTYPLRGARFSLSGASTGSSDPIALQSYALGKQRQIYDTTATDGCRILASAHVSGLTPANSLWFGLSVSGGEGDEGDEDDHTDDEGRVWLDDSAHDLWANIHGSNYDQVAFECFLDEVIAGWFAMYVDEDPEEGGFVFEQWPLAGLWCACSKPGGPMDIVHREVHMTAEQAVEKYGENMVSSITLGKALHKPDEIVPILQTIYPRKQDQAGKMPKNMPIASCHFEIQSKQVLRESGYHEMPVILPRALVIPDSVYPVGFMFDALPDVKSLNKVVELSLQNMDLAVAGMWIAEDDGVLNPRTLKIGARKVVVANSVESMKALQPATDFNIAEMGAERLQRQIRKVLMADLLEPQQRPGQPPTATEVQVKVEMIRQLLGPLYGRMQAEFLQPLIKRCFGLAYRAGVFGQAPQSLINRTVNIRYKTPMARSQQAVDVGAMDRHELSLINEVKGTGNTDILDNYNWDKAARRRAHLLGVPADLTPSIDDIKATREARAQAKQQQAQASAVMSMAGADPKALTEGAPA
jgi:hypothetical protein